MPVQALTEAAAPMRTKIRDARQSDLDALVSLLNNLFTIETDFVVDENRQRRGLRMMLDGCRKHRCIKVADIDGRAVGMCSGQTLVSTAEGGVVAMIEDMVVAPAYRGLGIGRRLMAAIEDWARHMGVRRLQLLADRANFSALDFYDRIGWLPTRLICLRRKWKDLAR